MDWLVDVSAASNACASVWAPHKRPHPPTHIFNNQNQNPTKQARTVAEAFLQAHQARHKHPGLGGTPVLPLSASASIGESARATAQEAERVYATLHDVLMKAVNYR